MNTGIERCTCVRHFGGLDLHYDCPVHGRLVRRILRDEIDLEAADRAVERAAQAHPGVNSPAWLARLAAEPFKTEYPAQEG